MKIERDAGSICLNIPNAFESIIRVNILWMCFFTFNTHLQRASQAVRGQHKYIYLQKEWSRKDTATIKLVTRKSRALGSRQFPLQYSILSFFWWMGKDKWWVRTERGKEKVRGWRIQKNGGEEMGGKKKISEGFLSGYLGWISTWKMFYKYLLNESSKN